MSPRRVSRFRGKLWELREFLHKWYDNILINIASCYSGIKESNWNEPNIFFSKHWLSHFLIHLWTLPFTSRRWETFATLSWTYCGKCFGEETIHLALFTILLQVSPQADHYVLVVSYCWHETNRIWGLWIKLWKLRIWITSRSEYLNKVKWNINGRNCDIFSLHGPFEAPFCENGLWPEVF